MKKLSFSRSLVCVSLLALLSSGASAAEKVTLKLAHNLERSHVVHQAFEEMSKEVNQLSNGAMKIRIYPSSQMGSARETLELLQNGALDMTKGSASDLESFDNVYAIYNLPFLFKDQNHFNKVVFGEVGKEIMESTKDKGFFALSAYVAGTRSFYAKKPITKPEDLKGLKIRVQASPVRQRPFPLEKFIPPCSRAWWTARKITCLPGCKRAISKSLKCSLKMNMPPSRISSLSPVKPGTN